MGAAVGLHGARLRSSSPWQRCSFVLTPFSRNAPVEETWPSAHPGWSWVVEPHRGRFLKPLAPGTAWMLPASLPEPGSVAVSASPT